MKVLPVVVLFGSFAGPAAAEVGPWLAKLRNPGAQGVGNLQAAKAWAELVQQGGAALMPALTALDGADAVASNWLRTAVDAISERELKAGRSLPREKLEEFVKDTTHSPLGRRLAYELLIKVDAQAPDRLLPGMLHDPSVELRRDAVARVLRDAERQTDKQLQIAAYRRALSGARDKDQVDFIARQLKALGEEVDLASHFGFIRTWNLLGPFDGTQGSGFARVYPPENRIDLSASCKGKSGQELRWIKYTTEDPYGLVDLNKVLGKHKGAVAYALAVVETQEERPVEIRVGSINAVKIYLNGRQLFACEEYHHGMRMDQYVGLGTLRPGRNEVLLKICQNEQQEPWAQDWKFQLRICDAVGTALPVKLADSLEDVK